MLLNSYLAQKSINQPLSEIVLGLEIIANKISNSIINEGKDLAGTSNVQGEEQMGLDVISNDIFISEFKKIKGVHTLISEEQEKEINVNESGEYIICFDPLDGSSLIDVNLAVGSIFGIYKGNNVIGKKIKEMVCAGCIVYGPRTTMLISFGDEVCEFTLKSPSSPTPLPKGEGTIEVLSPSGRGLGGGESHFTLTKSNLQIKPDTKLFSPGNLRACPENQKYKELLDSWVLGSKTLRYSGGMVPDLNAIFLKGEGIFTYPGYSKYPNGKLRLLYEVGPFSYLAKAAGGLSVTEKGENIMDLEIKDLHQRSTIIIGSENEVKNVVNALNSK